MAHLVLVRSPHARARIRSIDVEAARRAPGVVAVVTAADLGDIGAMPVNRIVPGMLVPPQLALALGDVAAQGTPVVAVVAESVYAAADAAASVIVDYDPTPGVAGARDALEASAPQIFANVPGNRSFTQTWRAGDADRAFSEARYVVPLTVRQQRLSGVPLEARAALATWSAPTGELTMWTSTQAPFRIRTEIARMLGLPESAVRVIAPDVGGGFGVKGGPYPEEVLVAWLARRLERPVKWVSTRAEDLVTTNHSRGSEADAALALDAGGRITGLRARIAAPLGSGLVFAAGGSPRNHGRCLPGAYTIENVDIAVAAAITTTPPVGAYRGAGRPEAAFLIERLVDEAARVLSIDPVEIRRRNLIPASKFPFVTATGQVYDSGNYLKVLEQTLALADYDGLRAEQARRRARGEVVGIGVATYVEPSGLGWESGLVRVERSGAVTVITGSSAHGQGHETTFAQIVADQLGVDPGDVAVLHGDTLGTPPGVGTFGSRSTTLGGNAAALAATAVREKGQRIAAQLLEAAAADVRPMPGGFGVVGSPGRVITWKAVADAAYRGQPLPPGDEPGLEATRFFNPEGEVWSFGAVVISVAIDRDTGTVRPERLVWTDDAGTIVNPLLAEGQLHGSLAQAWGQIMSEAIVFDGAGHVLTGTLMDYAIPRADDVPVPQLGHSHSPSPLNPLGVKGLGEAGTIGVPPATVNAVVDALAPFGVRHVDMPLTAEKVWRLVR
jgi:carbon-monoxide dehydrogenase large subunit